MTLLGKRIPIIFSLAIWFVVWELIGRVKLSLLIPPFSHVVAAGITILPTEKFAAAAMISLRSFAVGMAFALAIGIPLGVLMARSASVGRILGMWVNIFVSAPISALVPILMSVVGIGETTVVVTVFLFAVFVIILDTQVGVRQADRSLVEMALSFGARRSQLYTKVLLLSALPEILAGLRLAAIRGVKETLVDAVKIEGGGRSVPAMRALVDAGIPVMGHLGLTPQSLHQFGGYGLQARGVDVQRAVKLSDQAHLIFPYHKRLDIVEEASRTGRIGTTGRGIGPCYVDKIARSGIRVADLCDAEEFPIKLRACVEEKNRLLKALYDEPPFSYDELLER